MAEKPLLPVTRVERGSPFDDVSESHPAFGMIGLSRITCSPPHVMFGSAVKHGHMIALSIKTAERHTDIYHEWFSGRKSIIEVLITGNQLADMLTSMNVGEGVPCTINYANGDYVSNIPPQPTLKEESQAQMAEKITEALKDSETLLARMEAMLKEGISKKADKEHFQSCIVQLRNKMSGGMKFAGECFDEKVEKMVSHAKGEVESFINQKIVSAGLKALGADPIVQIDFKKEDDV